MPQLSKVKNKFDPRHLQRQKIIQELFAWSFFKNNPLSSPTQEIINNINAIDLQISANAPKWPLDKINRIDLCILRLAFFELTNKTNLPQKVIIDEAVELAKEFGSPTSPSFINGVLGAVIKKLASTL